MHSKWSAIFSDRTKEKIHEADFCLHVCVQSLLVASLLAEPVCRVNLRVFLAGFSGLAAVVMWLHAAA